MEPCLISSDVRFCFLSCRKKDISPAESAAITEEVQGLEALLSQV